MQIDRIRVPGEITPETAGNSQKHSANSLLTADRALVAKGPYSRMSIYKDDHDLYERAM